LEEFQSEQPEFSDVYEAIKALTSGSEFDLYEAFEANQTLSSASDADTESNFELYILFSCFGIMVIGVSVGIWMIIYAEFRNARTLLRCSLEENCYSLRRRNPSTSTKNSDLSAATLADLPIPESPIKLWRP